MVKYIIYLLLPVSLLLNLSCLKDENTPPIEEQEAWIYAQQEELNKINIPDFDQMIEIELPIRIEGDYDVPKTVYFRTNESQVELFNITHNTAYEILPKSCYAIETNEVQVQTGTEKITGIVKFSPKEVAALGGYNTERYLLPVEIVSDGLSVKENKAFFYFSFLIDSLIFEDDFEGSGPMPNPDYWSLCSRHGSDWDRYLSESYDQAYVDNGNLVFKTEKIDGQYVTGGIQTKDKFSFQYGKISVRAKFTKLVQGGWPAIWMMPQIPKYSGGWPNGGEIDIMEHLNKEPFVHHAVHSYYTKNNNDMHEATSNYNVEEYNVYEVEWSKNKISFFVNGEKSFTYSNLYFANDEITKQWPFDAPFYLIVNNSLGGPGTWPGEIEDSELPGVMEIDWIRITQ